MTVKIDGVEPNIFPDIEDLDARDAGRNVEVFLDVRIEGKPTPVTVKLSYGNKLLTWPLFWSRFESPKEISVGRSGHLQSRHLREGEAPERWGRSPWGNHAA